jgi:5-formyltetrahydrofolate cyclo-ligase
MTEPKKPNLRRIFAAMRKSLPRNVRTAAEKAIHKQLFELPAWQNAPLVCGYTAIGSEINMAPVWNRAMSDGKDYALPVTLSDAAEGRMTFRRMTGTAPIELFPARFGIPEPPETCPVLPLQDYAGALILVPGLVFDDSGYRLGYGGGYYDRFLADLRAASIPVTTVGLAFSCCRTQTLPREAFDLPVDCIIDERRVTFPHGIPH